MNAIHSLEQEWWGDISRNVPFGGLCPLCRKNFQSVRVINGQAKTVNIQPNDGPDILVATAREPDKWIFHHGYSPDYGANMQECVANSVQVKPYMDEWTSYRTLSEEFKEMTVCGVLSMLKDCPSCNKPLLQARYKTLEHRAGKFNQDKHIEYHFAHKRVTLGFNDPQDALAYYKQTGKKPESNVLGLAKPCVMLRGTLLRFLNETDD